MHWFTGVAVLISIGTSLHLADVSGAQSRSVLPPTPPLGHGAAAPSLILAQQAERGEDSYRYDPQGRRDPFDALIKEKLLAPPTAAQPPGPVIDPARPRGPLERFDLSALKLIGIVWGDLGRRAMIRAPDGKGYFVTVGMYMGQNGGRIMAITDGHLVLEEQHRDEEGKIVNKMLTLPLRRKESQQG
jgi:Tfp pilus assembly protein PilP